MLDMSSLLKGDLKSIQTFKSRFQLTDFYGFGGRKMSGKISVFVVFDTDLRRKLPLAVVHCTLE